MRLAPVVLSLLACACRTGLLDAPPVDDAGGVAAPDLARCAGTSTVVDVALTRLEAVDPSPFTGAALRVRVGYPLRPACDLPGDVELTEVPVGCDSCAQLDVTARVFRASDPSCTGTVEVTRVVELGDLAQVRQATHVTVRDTAPGGTLALTVERQPGEPGACDATPLGAPCLRDCQCATTTAPTARCIPVKMGARIAGRCALPCSEDVDCPDAAPACSATAFPVDTCLMQTTCASDADCRAGQRCTAVGGLRVCRPSPMEPTMPFQPCTCSAECGPGGACTESRDPPDTCAIPCTTIGDCPGHHGCGGLSCVDGRCQPNLC